MDASSRALDKAYLHRRPHQEKWSNLIFPKEDPSNGNFRLWREALPQIQALGGRLHIGAQLREGHKLWPWQYDIETLQLFHLRGDSVDLYEPALGEGAWTRANRYICTEEGTTSEPRGGPCLVAATEEGIVKIISFMDNPAVTRAPSTFREVLHEWGHTWMWDGLRLSGDSLGTWIEEAIKTNLLIAITDGSYMKELFPNMNSCTFIFECSRGGRRLTGAFPEQSIASCAYCGELLGLLAIHLILLSVNRVTPNLPGSVHIYSDCLGTLAK
jgi:hypothetical protein